MPLKKLFLAALIQTLCNFHWPQPFDCPQLHSPQIYHPQSFRRCLVFKTLMAYIFTLSPPMDHLAKRCLSCMLGTLSRVLWHHSILPLAMLTSPPGLIKAPSDASVVFMVSLQWSLSMAAHELFEDGYMRPGKNSSCSSSVFQWT